VGIDITPENIAVFEEKIKMSGFYNLRASVGDATNLYNIGNKSFDAVLCLGPMYHLPPEERELVFAECKRIAKDGAILAFAYISPMGAYLKASLMLPEHYPNKETNEYVLKQGTDDQNTGIFFYATPEQMAEKAAEHELEIIRNSGVDFTFDEKLVNNMNDEKFEAWLELADSMVENDSCAGLANHSLLICRK
jgi:ubiquinone/menaquinone biosynthesis C-methylase UbiE